MKEDAFTLEQRLDQALEEDRLNREALAEERATQALEEEHAEERDLDQAHRGSEELPVSAPREEEEEEEEEYGARSAGTYGDGGDGQAWNGDGTPFQAQRLEDDYGTPFVDQQHEYAAEATQQQTAVVQDQEVVLDDGSAGVSEGASPVSGTGGDAGEGGVGVPNEEDEVDFVGEDEEDNVWQ